MPNRKSAFLHSIAAALLSTGLTVTEVQAQSTNSTNNGIWFSADQERTSLVVPPIDPSLSIVLLLPNLQRVELTEGKTEVPAESIQVEASRTDPSGIQHAITYEIKPSKPEARLPLPHMMDLYVGGVHHVSWLYPYETQAPAPRMNLRVPGSRDSVPASTEGIRLKQGVIVRVDVPSALPVFDLIENASGPIKTAGQYNLLSGAGIVGGLGLTGLGILAIHQKNEIELQSAAITDPSEGERFVELSDAYKAKQAQSSLFITGGAAILGASMAFTFGPASTKRAIAKREKKAVNAALPIPLLPYASTQTAQVRP